MLLDLHLKHLLLLKELLSQSRVLLLFMVLSLTVLLLLLLFLVTEECLALLLFPQHRLVGPLPILLLLGRLDILRR
jgi:hypothetical protein